MFKTMLAAAMVVGVTLAATSAAGADERYPQTQRIVKSSKQVASHKYTKRHASKRGKRQVVRVKQNDNRTSLVGVVAPLANKVRQIMTACGSHIMSAVRHTRVAGSGNLSLHASGRAVDLSDNPDCIYSMLHDWPGGYSVDYKSVRCNGKPCPHVHISYAPGGREWGTRFVHYGTKARSRHAKRSHVRYHRESVYDSVDSSFSTAYLH